MPVRLSFLLAVVLMASGCVIVNSGEEFGKTLWGSSTKALEGARDKALAKTYDKSYWDVFRASIKAVNKKGYLIFKKDEVKGYMVLMHIRGSVNTTEVGVFFVELGEGQTRVEISSLSTNAKRIAAKNLFHLLDVSFGLAPADQEPPPENPAK